MWVRIAANYPIWYEVEPLAMYRKHSGSITKATVKNGIYSQGMHKATTIFQAYLPKENAGDLYNHTMQNCAFHCLEIAQSLINTRDVEGTIKLIQEALKFSRSFKVIRSACRLILLDVLPELVRRTLQRPSNFLTIVGKQPIDKEEAQ